MSRRGTVQAVHAVLPCASLADVEELHAAISRGEVVRHDDLYGFVVADGRELWHLTVVDDHDPAANAAALYVHVPDPDAVHERLSAAGHEPGPVRDEPWGMREFAVVDAAGNRIRVGRNA